MLVRNTIASILISSLKVAYSLHLLGPEDLQIHATTPHSLPALTCSHSPACQLAEILSTSLRSDDFSQGDGCGSRVGIGMRHDLQKSCSSLVIEICEGRVSHDDAPAIAHMLRNGTVAMHRTMSLRKTKKSTLCPDIARCLDDIGTCARQYGASAFHKSDGTAKSIAEAHTVLRKKYQTSGCDLFGALKWKDAGGALNWCGVNTPGEETTTLPQPSWSFGRCKNGQTVEYADMEYPVCDNSFDKACLRHDFGATAGWMLGLPIMACKVHNDLLEEALRLWETPVANDPTVAPMFNLAACGRLIPCAIWDPGDESGKTYKTIAGFSQEAKTAKSTSCPLGHCYLYE